MSDSHTRTRRSGSIATACNWQPDRRRIPCHRPQGTRLHVMRAAVFSDAYGNLVALDAVLSAAAADNVDEYWIIGDHVAHGPQPAEVIDRIKQLPSVRAVRGNTDRYVLDRSRSSLIPTVSPGMSAEEVQLLVDAEASHAWTRGAVTARGHWDWLAELQVEERAQLPDGTSVLLAHASPGRDDGPGITAEQSDQELLDHLGFQDCGATLVFTGHTHWPPRRLHMTPLLGPRNGPGRRPTDAPLRAVREGPMMLRHGRTVGYSNERRRHDRRLDRRGRSTFRTCAWVDQRSHRIRSAGR